MKKLFFSAVLATAISMLGLTAFAQTKSQKFQKWGVYNFPDAPLAMTFNDSDNGLGPVCSEDSANCYWMILSSKTSCATGVESPVLINASSGSYSLMVSCTGTVNLGGVTYHRYVLSSYEEMQGIAKSSNGLIGFAIPMDSGAFSVLRFDLSGSQNALALFDVHAESFLKRSQKKSTKDLRL